MPTKRTAIPSIPAPAAQDDPKLSNPAYGALPLNKQYKIDGFQDIKFKKKQSSIFKTMKGLFAFAVPIIGWFAPLFKLSLIPKGHIGVSTNNGKPEFLRPGWHFLLSPFRSLEKVVPLNKTSEIINGTKSIVNVKDGEVGLIVDEKSGDYILLGPGMHQWNSPTIKYVGIAPIKENMVDLGPFTLITVPPGEVAVTTDNGQLKILPEKVEDQASTGSRTFLLNHAKWKI